MCAALVSDLAARSKSHLALLGLGYRRKAIVGPFAVNVYAVALYVDPIEAVRNISTPISQHPTGGDTKFVGEDDAFFDKLQDGNFSKAFQLAFVRSVAAAKLSHSIEGSLEDVGVPHEDAARLSKVVSSRQFYAGNRLTLLLLPRKHTLHVIDDDGKMSTLLNAQQLIRGLQALYIGPSSVATGLRESALREWPWVARRVRHVPKAHERSSENRPLGGSAFVPPQSSHPNVGIHISGNKTGHAAQSEQLSSKLNGDDGPRTPEELTALHENSIQEKTNKTTCSPEALKGDNDNELKLDRGPAGKVSVRDTVIPDTTAPHLKQERAGKSQTGADVSSAKHSQNCNATSTTFEKTVGSTQQSTVNDLSDSDGPESRPIASKTSMPSNIRKPLGLRQFAIQPNVIMGYRSFRSSRANDNLSLSHDQNQLPNKKWILVFLATMVLFLVVVFSPRRPGRSVSSDS
eukprot:GHVT01030230.1.p1 GENE.GHVT01030230.1~~GHVT01030230.1.p1  ORF type:complete len:460 (-),score=24.46 GHVT01030230.1:2167-3546(-)